MCQDLARNYHRDGYARCSMKLDLRKAYDSVDQSFFRAVFSGLKFPDKFMLWVLLCVSTASFSIIFNGSPYGFFHGKSGSWQGDPL